MLPKEATADALLDRFMEWVSQTGLSLYSHQEEAILELLAGKHVVLATPTGSGKSMVAFAMHFIARARRDELLHLPHQGAGEREVLRAV
jgi:ATP-dependent helicase YprA (DUF1998 family)